ncbi:hypothetical protein DYB37_008430 [Aphanomyces astaci]|uniref:Uncharacterized protein n=1 Tax=Aphanomyces astaci TaxID=112090 RepID=A0A3R6XAC7_APHAT|nr:hypothetical protein DYB35_007980 [Aphanomyces astaci]RHZ15755.1 hypothetical protein DYB37_008430 [Aphanomyces astaci]
MTLKKPPPPKKRTNKVLVELLPLQHDEVDLEQQRARRMAHSTSDVMKLQDDSWRVLQLGAGGEKRLTAIHAIADRQLDSVDSDMLTCGLVDMFAKCESFQ